MSHSHPSFPPGTVVEVIERRSKIHGHQAVVLDRAQIGAPTFEPGSLLIRIIRRPPPGTRKLWVVRETHVRVVPSVPD